MAVDVAGEQLAVVAEAKTWLATPFHHAARVKGAGVDCAQLLIAVYTSQQLVDEPPVGFYPPDWFLHRDTDVFTDWVARECVQVDEPALGDVALFKYGRVPSHGAIVIGVDPLQVLHAFNGLGVIVDRLEAGQPLVPRLVGFWRLRRWAEVDR